MNRRSLMRCATLAGALAATLQPGFAAAQQFFSPAQVRTLSPLESAVVDGLAPVPAVDLNLRSAATVQVWAYNKGSPKLAVQRSNLGVPAAVYAGAPHAVAPLLPPAPGSRAPQTLDFQTVGDSVEAWATMTAGGVPHLRVNGFGDFRAEATASWTSRFTLGGSTSKEVVLRFVVPPTVVAGNLEMQGPAWWRARMRTDVLVNGFPAWSTEAWRLRADYIQTGGAGSPDKALTVLQTFGEPMPFATNDEDAASGNDSNGGNVSVPSNGKLVYLNLGRFYPGQAIELTMVVRGSAFTQSDKTVRGGSASNTSHRCKPNPATGGFFCSQASMSVQGANADAPQVTLMP